MKKLYILLVFGALFLSSQTASAQFVFNDTMLVFNILKTRVTPDNDGRYLIGFQTSEGITGKIVLSMCNCYCDSIWDAWPKESDDLFTGGQGTMTYLASGSPQNPQLPSFEDGVLRGRLNIWKMPGAAGILRQDPFTLPVKFVVDP